MNGGCETTDCYISEYGNDDVYFIAILDWFNSLHCGDKKRTKMLADIVEELIHLGYDSVAQDMAVNEDIAAALIAWNGKNTGNQPTRTPSCGTAQPPNL